MWFPLRFPGRAIRDPRPQRRHGGKARRLRCEPLEERAMLADVSGTSVALDSAGNIYTTGYLQRWSDFGPGAQEAWVATDGGQDGYLAKYAPDNTLQWVKRLRGADYQALFDVAVDADGSVYVTGKTKGSATFDGWEPPLDAPGYASMVAKIDPNGSVLWAHVFGFQENSSTGNSGAFGVALDDQGSLYVSGHFSGVDADFDPRSGVQWLMTAADNQDEFVAKFDAAGGVLQWATAISATEHVWCYSGTSNGDGMSNGSLVADASGVYTTGIFLGTLQFGGQSFPNQGSFDTDGFVAKLNPDGTPAWLKQYTNRNVDSVAIDAGYVYTAAAGGGTYVGEGFVAKYDKGNPDAPGGWYKRWEESSDASARMATGVFDLQVQGGNLQLTGAFKGTVDFNLDPTAQFTLTAIGDTDVFVWTMTDDGGFLHAARVGGTSTDRGTGIAVDTGGNVVSTGVFRGGPVDFDPGSGTAMLTALGAQDAFVSKLDSNMNYQWAFQIGSYDQAIDDGDPGYQESGKGWKSGTYGGYNGDYREHTKGTGTNKAQWTVSGLAAGTYDVYATWVARSNNATNAQYTVNGTAAPLMNQRLRPDDLTDNHIWERLGTFAANASGKITVVLSDKANGAVVADAIRVMINTPAGPAAPTTALGSLSGTQTSVSSEMLSAIDFWMSDLGDRSAKRKRSSKTLDLLPAGIDLVA